jgi:DNA-binding response OmpR family regulator
MAEGKSILVVDDDLTLREMYEERLKQDGYIVIGAADGAEALKKAQEENPALVILDIMMPKINGIDVFKQLRSDEKTKGIPIVILTALVQEIDKVKELMTDKDSYLIKSQDMPKTVIEKVKAALG